MLTYRSSITSIDETLAVVTEVVLSGDAEARDSSRLRVVSEQGWQNAPSVPWLAEHALVTDTHIIGVGSRGELLMLPLAGGKIVETELPTTEVSLRVQGVRKVGGNYFVCGMPRQVISSPDGYAWRSLNPGLDIDLDSESVGSISNLAADPGGLVAVGMKGAIFRFDGSVWHREPSQHTVWLKDVAWHEGQYWVVGKNGTLLVGQKLADLKNVETDVCEALDNLVVFRGAVYAVGDGQLWRLSPAGLELICSPGPVCGIDATATTFWLLTNGAVYRTVDLGEFSELASFDPAPSVD